MPTPHIPDGRYNQLDYYLKNLLKEGRIERVEGGYNWTKEEIKRSIKFYRKSGKRLGLR